MTPAFFSGISQSCLIPKDSFFPLGTEVKAYPGVSGSYAWTAEAFTAWQNAGANSKVQDAFIKGRTGNHRVYAHDIYHVYQVYRQL